MNANRREFMQVMGAGAASIGLATAVPAAVAQADNAAKTAPARRKMVIRADDIGMSKVCNIGTFDAIDGGMISVAAIMLADPGTEDALERLKAYPWISIDWHMHMWGSPVADHKLVPTLLEKDKSGPFADRFRMDLAQAQDVKYEEALTELRAQLDRCGKILGRVPDTGAGGNDRSPWQRAVQKVAEEYNIAYGFSASEPTQDFFVKHIKDAQDRGEAWAKYWPATASPGSPALPKWASRKISSTGLSAFVNLLTDSISSVESNYDPVLFYTEDRSGILKTPMDTIRWQAWHPGYVDYYTYRLGERVNRARAQQFVVSRPQDSWAMRDVRLKNWIKENKIELINFRDALYGTSEFQNHLRAVGSDLAMI